MPARREIRVVGVEHQVFHGRLHLGVHRSFNGVTAGVEHLLGRGLVHALLGGNVAHHLIEESIGEVRGSRGGVLLACVLFRQHQRLGGGVAVILFRDDALLPHVVEQEVPAVDQVFRVGIGVVVGRVLGNGRNGSALPEGELADILIKVLVGCRLHTLNGTREADGVEVSFQDGLLGVAAAQAEGAVNFAQLAQCTLYAAGAVIVRQVLDELLLQRGRALLGAVDGQDILVDHRADGALEVDTRLIVEVFVLGTDERILQIAGDLLQVGPHAVAVGGAQGGVFHLSTGVRVGSHHHTGLAQLNVVQVQQVAVVGCSIDHIVHGPHGQQAAANNAQADHRGNEPPQHAPEGDTPLFFRLFGFLGGTGSSLLLAAAAQVHFTSRLGPLLHGVPAADLSCFIV